KIVPEYSVVFLRIIILISLIDCLANPLVISAKATGNIRRYKVILGSFLLLIVPVSYLFLKLGFPSYSVFLVHLIVACVGQVIRVYLVKGLIRLSIKDYILQVVFKIIVVFIVSSILPMLVFLNYTPGLVRLFLVIIAVMFSVLPSIWCLGTNTFERDMVLFQI